MVATSLFINSTGEIMDKMNAAKQIQIEIYVFEFSCYINMSK